MAQCPCQNGVLLTPNVWKQHWENVLHFFGVSGQILFKSLDDYNYGIFFVALGSRDHVTSLNMRLQLAFTLADFRFNGHFLLRLLGCAYKKPTGPLCLSPVWILNSIAFICIISNSMSLKSPCRKVRGLLEIFYAWAGCEAGKRFMCK